MRIRIATLNDLEDIVGIYNEAVLTKKSTGDLDPVTINSRLQWFKNHSSEKYPIYIAEIDNTVVGWISLSPYRPGRQALRFTAEVSYYIHADYKRKGIGSELLRFIIKESSKFNIKTIFTIILEQNTASINLIKKFKFEQWGFLPNIADFDGTEYGHLYFGLKVN